MKYCFFIITLLISITTNAQNQNSVWCFGDSAGIDFSNISNPIPIMTSVKSRGSCASIADSSGQLLFYAFCDGNNLGNSGKIYNKQHSLMQNGDSVRGTLDYNEYVIIPMPGDSTKYYLFCAGVVVSTTIGFYYSIVDMSLNNGSGAVIQKNIQLNSFRNADAVQTVKHGNGRDWWVISKYSNNPPTNFNRYYVYLVTPTGISAPIIQDFNNALDGDLQKIIFNGKGNKLMQLNFIGFMCEYDFDRCTGIISNPSIIYPEQTGNYSRYFWEGAYSPNDSLFYVTVTWNNANQSDTSRLLQYNLFAPDIIASCDTLYISKLPIMPGAIRLAPDGKIYLTSAYNWGGFIYPYPDSVFNQCNMNLGVVNIPDTDGAGCNFQPFSFSLGGARTYAGLPNNPNYELGPLIGSACDTITEIKDETLLPFQQLNIYYHQAWQKAFINAQNLKGKKIQLNVYTTTGQLIYKTSSISFDGYFTHDLDMYSFQSGVYLIVLQTEKERLFKKFVKQ